MFFIGTMNCLYSPSSHRDKYQRPLSHRKKEEKKSVFTFLSHHIDASVEILSEESFVIP